MPKKTIKTRSNNGVNLGIEAELWQAADKLRGHLDAAEVDERGSVDETKETLKVFTVNYCHGKQGSLAKRGTGQSRKPLGSVSVASRLSLPRVMRGKARVKDVEKKL